MSDSQVIPPDEITDATLTSSNVPEPAPGEILWAKDTVFKYGDRAILASPSAAVTISASGFAVIKWPAHGLPDGTPVVLTTDGALPTGLQAGKRYFTAKSTLNTFRVAEEPGGIPLTVSAPGSGTHTATAEVHQAWESQLGDAETVTISIANPAVVSLTDHGLAANTPVLFQTTNHLPTGLTAGVIYYVLAPATDTFELAATPGGSAIVTSGTQAGTHTAVSNPNIGNPPAIDDGGNWLAVGPTNRWAAIDLERNTASVADDMVEFVITPGRRVDSVGLVGMVGTSVEIRVDADASTLATNILTDDDGDYLTDEDGAYLTDGPAPAFFLAENLSTRVVVNGYDYAFNEFTYRTDVTQFDLPPYTGGIVTVRVKNPGDRAQLGALVIGRSVYLGQALQQLGTSGDNFSTFNRDTDGNSQFIPRQSVPKISPKCIVDKEETPAIYRIKQQLSGKIALWCGVSDSSDSYFELTNILGVATQFDINLDDPDYGLATVNLELTRA